MARRYAKENIRYYTKVNFTVLRKTWFSMGNVENAGLGSQFYFFIQNRDVNITHLDP